MGYPVCWANLDDYAVVLVVVVVVVVVVVGVDDLDFVVPLFPPEPYDHMTPCGHTVTQSHSETAHWPRATRPTIGWVCASIVYMNACILIIYDIQSYK